MHASAPRNRFRSRFALLPLVLVALLATASSSVASEATFAVADGYDAKQGKTLVQEGKLYTVQTSDNDWYQVEAGYWLSLRFAGSVPAGATIESVKLQIERHEEEQFSPAALLWQVGGGTLAAPIAALSYRPSLRLGKAAEATDEWDVTATIDTPAELNGLVFVVRNQATNGKKALLDRVTLAVRYSEQASAPTITSSPNTQATVGQPYSYQAQASGSQPITWSLQSGPAGMTINTQTGQVNWTPTAAGGFPVSIRAANAIGQATQNYTITVGLVPPQAATRAVADGYDAKQGKTLVQEGKLYTVQTSDNDWYQVEAGYWLSLRFAGSVPAGATIESVKLQIERHEEEQFSPAALLWQVGGGTLAAPIAALSYRPSLRLGKAAEATDEWDVTATIDTPAELNGLVFVGPQSGYERQEGTARPCHPRRPLQRASECADDHLQPQHASHRRPALLLPGTGKRQPADHLVTPEWACRHDHQHPDRPGQLDTHRRRWLPGLDPGRQRDRTGHAELHDHGDGRGPG